MDGPLAQGFVSLTGPLAPRVADCPAGNAYKVSVTGLAFYVIWHEKHSADWLSALASPYPAAPDFPRKRRKGGGTSHQRGNAGVVHEVYDSLFFSSNFLFPLEGKCHVVAKGCTGQSSDVIFYRYPDRQSAASLATSWSSPPLQAGGIRFNKCGCKGFIIRGRLL